jgi:hypothetical protein
MAEPSRAPDPNGERPPRSPKRSRLPEANLGGADAAEKTTYVTGSGTEPEGRTAADTPVARVSAGGGSNPVIWIAIGVAMLVLIGYLVGVLR